ncbi:MAG: glycoside hydrolase family 172 protein [Gemmatimonadota bacterium]
MISVLTGRPRGVSVGARARVFEAALLAGLVGIAAHGPLTAQEPQAGMVAELRALYRADLLPRYRAASLVAQISSYDTTGGNDDGFQGTYSYVRKEGDFRVLADLAGPGVVNRIWTPTPTDRMVAFYFDGEDEARLRLPFSELFSGNTPPFVKPVVGNEVGGYFSYLPLPYARSLKIVYEGDDIRFHQIQYRSYPEHTDVASFRTPLGGEAAVELERVVDAWNHPGRRPWGEADVHVEERAFAVDPGNDFELFRVERGGRILGIEMERAPGTPPRGPGVALQAWWDGGSPGIAAPVNDFFGYAFGAPAAAGLIVGSRAGIDYAYFPMPFDRSATLALQVLPSEPATVRGTARIFWSEVPRDPTREGRFYATWRREREPARGAPYLLLDAEGPGHQVGVLLQAQGLTPGMTEFFEGDDVTTIDGALALHGTGSEDFFNGGWYAILDRWDRGMSLPTHGALDYSLPLSRTGAYRFYLADKLSFVEHLRQTIEHGPEGNAVPVDYTSVAFHYGERSSAAGMTPQGEPVAQAPPEHHFYPQLMEMSVWFGTSVAFADGALELKGDPTALVRFDVSALPPGRYRVKLSYRRSPDGAEFSVWRRQTQLSDWLDAFAPETTRVEAADMGEVELTEQTRSITVRTRAVEGRAALRIDRLILEEVR